MAYFRVEENSHRLVFRNDLKGCDRETATEVRISGHRHSEDIYMPWPSSRDLVMALQETIRGAFDAGKREAQAEIREALGMSEIESRLNYLEGRD